MKFHSFLAGLLLALPLGSVYADVIQIPVGEQAQELQTLDRPTLGMTQAQVEEKFGEPTAWTEAKGEPPISKWEYDQFVVYFESEYVIHSVLKHVAKAEQ